MCLASLAFSFSTVSTWENVFFAHLLVCRPLPHGELLQRGPAVRTARLFCLHSHASPADATALALGMEVGIAASWRCLSSIFLPGAWHTPHQKDTLLSSPLLCSPRKVATLCGKIKLLDNVPFKFTMAHSGNSIQYFLPATCNQGSQTACFVSGFWVWVGMKGRFISLIITFFCL